MYQSIDSRWYGAYYAVLTQLELLQLGQQSKRRRQSANQVIRRQVELTNVAFFRNKVASDTVVTETRIRRVHVPRMNPLHSASTAVQVLQGDNFIAGWLRSALFQTQHNP